MSRQLPDPIEVKLISELADLEPGQVQKLESSMNQILNLIHAKHLADTPLELNPQTDKIATKNNHG